MENGPQIRLGEFVEELVGGGVELLAVGVVGAVLNLLADRGDLVGSHVVGFQRRQQMARARQLEAVAGAGQAAASAGTCF